MITAVTGARVFDGDQVIEARTVVIDGASIAAVGGPVPPGAALVDAAGGTLLPGLIDSHVHTDMDGLRDALKFGVTTELEMMGRWSARQRGKIGRRNDVADLRSPGMGVTPKGGHPTEYMKSSSNLFIRYLYKFPSVSTPAEAARFVSRQVSRGADYIKVFIEDGSCIGFPGLPVLDDATLAAAMQEAHLHDKLAIAHITTAEGAQRAVDAGVDGLGHLFLDSPGPELIGNIAAAGVFVVPTLVTLSTAFGNNAAALAADERVRSRLDRRWLDSLSRSMNVYPQGNLDNAYASVRALRDAGADILAGSDVSEPIPVLGGLAHGASLHHELQLLVAAGLRPEDALRAATSAPARRFGLTDRGRIFPGALADLLLVDGDPTASISDTLSIGAVWRRGVRQPAALKPGQGAAGVPGYGPAAAGSLRHGLVSPESSVVGKVC
jgi:imidazolonepropionase-like amidohydrolase